MRNLWKNSAWLTFFILQKEMSTNFSNTITFDRQPACLFLSKAYLIVFKSFFIHMSTQAFVSLLRVLDQPKNEAKNRGTTNKKFFLDSYFSCCLRQCEHRFACRYNNNVFSAAATPLLHLVSYILSRSTKQVKEAPKELVLEETLASVTLWVEPTLIIKGTHFFLWTNNETFLFSASAGRSFNMMEALKLKHFKKNFSNCGNG